MDKHDRRTGLARIAPISRVCRVRATKSRGSPANFFLGSNFVCNLVAGYRRTNPSSPDSGWGPRFLLRGCDVISIFFSLFSLVEINTLLLSTGVSPFSNVHLSRRPTRASSRRNESPLDTQQSWLVNWRLSASWASRYPSFTSSFTFPLRMACFP